MVIKYLFDRITSKSNFQKFPVKKTETENLEVLHSILKHFRQLQSLGTITYPVYQKFDSILTNMN